MKENFHGSGIRASEFVTFSQLSQFDPVDYVHGSSTSKWMHQPESVLPAGVALPMMRRRKNRGKGETEELKKEQEQDRHIAEVLQTLSVRVSYCRPAKLRPAMPGPGWRTWLAAHFAHVGEISAVTACQEDS